jgi:hypothetical protein
MGLLQRLPNRYKSFGAKASLKVSGAVATFWRYFPHAAGKYFKTLLR